MQPIVMTPPHRADRIGLVEDDWLQARSLELLGCRQPSGSGADDDGVCGGHRRRPPSTLSHRARRQPGRNGKKPCIVNGRKEGGGELHGLALTSPAGRKPPAAWRRDVPRLAAASPAQKSATVEGFSSRVLTQ